MLRRAGGRRASKPSAAAAAAVFSQDVSTRDAKKGLMLRWGLVRPRPLPQLRPTQLHLQAELLLLTYTLNS